MANVTVTPHLGYVTRETLAAFYGDTVDNVSAWLDGRLQRIANPQALEKAKAR
jgi:phosphoglycerate dehydrogenase-like enzyme